MKFDDYLIVTDLDGTYLDDKSRSAAGNDEAIKYFNDNGGHFTFASGRCYREVKKAIPNCAELCNAPGILGNGAYLFDYQSESKLDEHYIDPIVVEIIDKVAELFPNVGARSAKDNTYYTPKIVEGASNDLLYFGIDVIVADFHALDPKKFYKTVFGGPDETVTKVRNWLFENYGDRFYICQSCSSFVELLPLGCSKGDRLRDIKTAIGKPNAKVCACGDYENDYTMLSAADIAVIPQNGLDYLKKLKNAVCVCNNNDGAIADFIYKLDREL